MVSLNEDSVFLFSKNINVQISPFLTVYFVYLLDTVEKPNLNYGITRQDGPGQNVKTAVSSQCQFIL